MSRGAFVTGLMISGLLHFSLLRASMPTATNPAAQQPPLRAPVRETELAKLPEPPPPPEETALPQEPKQPVDPPAQAPAEPQKVAEVPPPPPPLEPEPAPEPSPSVPEPERVETALDSPPPEPELTKMVEMDAPAPEELAQSRGDVAGRQDVPPRPPAPELRVDWGDEQTAVETLRVGKMKLAVLRSASPRPVISSQANLTENRWRREAYRPEITVRYSNRLRVVDDVPAFQRVRRELDLQHDERLVVLLPTEVERMLQSAELAAAFERGMDMESVSRFGGRFTTQGSALSFEITRVQSRSIQE